ncbi:phosphatase PAP2 family protein [Foetidibacter luteolus]|uniref:phosphatase PAP2 family protein n=1 Tax=Foetidibacter luteolus TaxID=2608880 RepID=UPI001A992ACF|nr:phosphatase PAP2 family protein [Foetidibacter luteolus]
MLLLLLPFISLTYLTNAQSADSAALQYKPLRFTGRQLLIPATLMAGGILLNSNAPGSFKKFVVDTRNNKMPHFRTHADDYLQYAPIALAYGLDAAGVKSRTDLANRTAILLKGELIMTGTVCLLKNRIDQRRPDGVGYDAFPSGHTAQAFAAATFLAEEYKHRFKWMPYAAYSIAGSVGALRIANNRHYISDVLMGAGIGFLSMKVAYWTHGYMWGRKKRINTAIL